ncbi:MAG TPA: VOC family protein [Thermoplasmata archaeon]|nr:VOC family protein [Thermoplasmata archaeon]
MPKRSTPKKRAAKRPVRAAKGAPRFLSVAVVVSDRTRAVAWYTEKFGLDHVDDMDHWQTVGRKGVGGVLHLCQVSEFDKDGQLEPGNSGIAFTLPGDFVASCKALEERGVEFSSPATKYDWGWGATVRDPDGNEIYLTTGG